MRANNPKSHPNTPRMSQIISSTHGALLRAKRSRSARVPCQKPAKTNEKSCDSHRKCCKFFRARRTAHSNFCCRSSSEHALRMPAVVAHVLWSMLASSAPKSRRISRKIARFSIETGAVRCAKCAQTIQNHIQTLLECKKSFLAPTTHSSERSAPAAHVSRAKNLQNPTQNRAILIENFASFSRATHRTFNILLQIFP